MFGNNSWAWVEPDRHLISKSPEAKDLIKLYNGKILRDSTEPAVWSELGADGWELLYKEENRAAETKTWYFKRRRD